MIVNKSNFKETEDYKLFQQILQGVFKEEFSSLDRLIDFLENKSDYFWAPASVKYHNAFPGGLIAHSLNVYETMTGLKERNNLDILPDESIAICGLLHDLGKVNFYVLEDIEATPKQKEYMKSLFSSSELKQFDEEGCTKAWATTLIDWVAKQERKGDIPKKSIAYKVQDGFPIGHSVRGLSLLQDLITLTNEEKLAIRWHSGIWEEVVGDDKLAFQKARNEYPLVNVLMLADYEAAFVKEVR